ncbi:glycosyltransferase family 2 protein [Thalassospira permensis]|nr:glycosyltransferase family A protein [Thalassospira permensis]
MKNTPLVSIGMSVHNSANTISAAIISILNQSYPFWELIIIDDGSTDNTRSIIDSFSDSRIKFSHHQNCRGLAYRLNQAIDTSSGKYFMRMDGDDICFPERIHKQVGFLESHPSIDLLGTSLLIFRDNGEAIGVRKLPSDHKSICKNPLSGFELPHPTWMGKIEWFRHFRYDENQFKSQDYDVLLRSYKHSCFAVLPEVLLGYREDFFNFQKRIMSRKFTIISQIKCSKTLPDYLKLIYSITLQITKLSIDYLFIDVFKKKPKIYTKKLKTSEETEKLWKETWNTCN